MFQQLLKAFAYPDKVYKFAIFKVKEVLLWNYYYSLLREPKLKSRVPYEDPSIQTKVIEDLKENGFKVVDFEIDIDKYRRYMKDAKYRRFQFYYNGGKANNFVEKSLEHYLAAEMLNLSKTDVYIDIANSHGPAARIYHELYGCKVYEQDLVFQHGIHGNRIGGDAGQLPIQNDFATKMALHCSFEHFEQDSDIRFIKEAKRVLRNDGKVCILPLYLSNRYAIQTNPAALSRKGIPFENDALLYCTKGIKNQHLRFYDVTHFISRIRENLNELKLTIYVIRNEKEVDVSCYIKFIALFEKE